MQTRYDELSRLVRGLYENLMSGVLPERQYKQLSVQYDREHADLEAKMDKLKAAVAEERAKPLDIEHFIRLNAWRALLPPAQMRCVRQAVLAYA